MLGERVLEKEVSLSRYHSIIWPLILIVSDYLAVLCAEFCAASFRNFWLTSHLTVKPFLAYFVIPFFFLGSMLIMKAYSDKVQYWKILEKTCSAVFYGTAAVIVVLYSVKEAEHTSRMFIMLTGLFSFFSIVIFRYILKKLFISVDMFKVPILIIGGGKTAELLVKGIKDNYGSARKIIGFLEDNSLSEGLKSYPVLGGFADAERVIRSTGVKDVIIAAPGLAQNRIVNLINRVQPLVKNLSVVPNLIDVPMSGIEAESFFNEKIMLLRMKNNLARPVNKFIKKTFDFVGTLAGTVLIAPFLVMIALWIKLDSPGPIIFTHWRIGKNGQKFGCYKFRTMCIDADAKLKRLLANDPAAKEEWEREFKLKNDPRVTSAGRFLRRTSLDELPQIFNVLKGEMSLVGPRPVVEEELVRYGEYVDDYLMVRPGITGMWQVNGRSDTTYEERVKMDSWYVRNWSVWIDIMLLWRTIRSVIKCEGAY